MIRISHVSALVAALWLAAPVTGLAQEDKVLRLDRAGMDGPNYYFDVRCTDGRSGSLVLTDETNQLCAQATDRPPVCRATSTAWTLQQAAAAVCR